MQTKAWILLINMMPLSIYSGHLPAADEAMPGQPIQTAPVACTCYCLASWGAAIAAPYVPNLPTKVVGGILARTETETETGDVFWTANVNRKSYACGTANVTATTALSLNLVHNTYSRSRARTGAWRWGWPPFVWGAWTPWTVYLPTGNLNDRDALLTSAPPSTPWCTDKGVACP